MRLNGAVGPSVLVGLIRAEVRVNEKANCPRWDVWRLIWKAEERLEAVPVPGLVTQPH